MRSALPALLALALLLAGCAGDEEESGDDAPQGGAGSLSDEVTITEGNDTSENATGSGDETADASR